jgi:mono/diheme cytochrome c family protein
MVAAKETAMPRQILVGLLLLLVGILSAVQGRTAGTGQQEKGLKKVDISYTAPTSGAEMYKSYCAACHGTEGKGDGPAVEFLKTPPPDLRMLAQHNQGKYPSDHVAMTLRLGNRSRAHGTSDMPLWGELFRTVDVNQSLGELRVKNLTKFIESMQLK